MMEEGRNLCVFRNVLNTCSIEKEISGKELTEKQKTKIAECTKERKDNFTLFETEKPLYHKDCYAEYTSREKIKRHLLKQKKTQKDDGAIPAKRTRSSTGPPFDFNKQCLFCGESCNVHKDTKHPDRWEKNPGFLCRTADRDGKTFKAVLLDICDRRSDILADLVRIRVEGASTDLHAANGRYHKLCYTGFVSERNIQAASSKYDNESDDREPLNYVIRSIRNEPEKIWSAKELHNYYMLKGGTDNHITRFTVRLKLYLRSEVYFFDSPGVSTVIMHQSKASKVLNVIKTEPQEEQTGNEVAVVAKKIKSELSKIPSLYKTYPVLNDDNLMRSCSDTLQSLFLSISPKFQEHLKIVSLVSSMINTVCNGRTSMLQVSLSSLVGEKKIIDHLHEYGVTSTYDEHRRFRISAASANEVLVQLYAKDGLVQGVSDNFDSPLNTQNGMKQTHSLATILVQNGSFPKRRIPIPRLTKREVKDIPLEDVEISIFLASIDKYLSKFNDYADVYTVFDRYFPKSIKSDTRLQRFDGFRRVHHIGRSSPLPGREICMASTKTKQNLIEVVCEYILEMFSERAAQQKLVVTAGTRRKRTDLETHSDEADYIIPQQVNAAVKLGHTSIKVISADTDVFVLLCYHYLKQDWSQADIYLESFQPDKGVISIKHTVQQHSSIIPSLTALHAISGCDSVPKLFGIGKGKALSAMKKMPLNAVGNTDSSRSDMIEEGKMFVAKIYGVNDSSSSSKNRSLMLEEDADTGVLKPKMLPSGIDIAPAEVLRVIKCNCSATHCRTQVCSCHKSAIPCTMFCACECLECLNPHNLNNQEEIDDEEDDDENVGEV